MNCSRWRKMISQACNGQLPPALAGRLDGHLRVCQSCNQAFALNRSLRKVLQEEPRAKAREDFNRRLWAKIEAEAMPVQKPKFWRLLPEAGGVLALSAVAASVIIVTYHSLEMPPLPGTGIQAVKKLTALPAQRSVQTASKSNQAEFVLPAAQNQGPAMDKQAAVLLNSVKQASSYQAAHSVEMKELSTKEARSIMAHAAVEPPVRPIGGVSLYTTVKAPSLGAACFATPPARKTVIAGATGIVSGQPVIAGIQVLGNKINLNRNDRARLEFRLDQAGHVCARIYTREGKRVRTLLDEDLAAGARTVEWDGSTDSGQKAATGIYVLDVQGEFGEKHFKIVVIK